MEDEKLDSKNYREKWKKDLELYCMKGFGMLAFICSNSRFIFF